MTDAKKTINDFIGSKPFIVSAIIGALLIVFSQIALAILAVAIGYIVYLQDDTPPDSDRKAPAVQGAAAPWTPPPPSPQETAPPVSGWKRLDDPAKTTESTETTPSPPSASRPNNAPESKEPTKTWPRPPAAKEANQAAGVASVPPRASPSTTHTPVASSTTAYTPVASITRMTLSRGSTGFDEARHVRESLLAEMARTRTMLESTRDALSRQAK